MIFYRVLLALAMAGAGAASVQAAVHPDVRAWRLAALAFFAVALSCFDRLQRRR